MAKSRLDEINSRGMAGGWHAQQLQARAAREGRTMADVFKESIRGSSAFSVPAKATAITSQWITYQFLDGSKARFENQQRRNPAFKSPITRQWKPMLVRTNARGEVQVAPQGVQTRVVAKVKARGVKANPGGRGKLAKVDYPAIAHLMRKDFFALSSDEKRELLAEADRVKYRLPANASGSRARYFYDAVEKMRAGYTHKSAGSGRRNPSLNPFDSILNSFGYTGRNGTPTGDIWRDEYRNGPGKSITVISDRRGAGKPTYAWISNGPILPAHSGVRTKQTVTTLKRTLKSHLKKMEKR